MTGRKSRNKGNRAERDIVKWCRQRLWPHAERNGGGFPGSDLTATHGFTVEAKDHAKLDLAGFVEQLKAEMDYDGNDVGAVIHKRRGKTDVGEWYATMPVDVLARLVARAGYGLAEDQWPANLDAQALTG